MNIHRIAIVFDDRARPDTTGVHCRNALAGMVEVVHFRPDRVGEIPADFDLYLSVDDDTEHRLPERLRPRAYWAIDTHRELEARVRRAAGCDLVFAAQRDGAEGLRAAGIAGATWLPLACDPDVHRRHEVETRYDFAFVGNVFPGPRAELLGMLAGKFPRHFIGRAYREEMAEAYSAARVVFNRSVGGDVNMRVFEALACGSLLLTDDTAGNGLGELFRDGEHLATYRDAGELLEKLAYYLAHDDERERIAAAGRAEAVTRHTYRHRMGRLLEVAGRELHHGGHGGHGGGKKEAMNRGAERVAVVERSDTTGGPRRDPGPVHPGHAAPATQPGEGMRSGLASVIVPCFNQLEFTRECVRALVRHTRRPWELIVVDNGSTDGTGAYLAGVQDGASMPVTVVANPRNLGFPAAVNQGLSVARGSYLVLLNNDAVATECWLDQLIALVSSDPAIGLAGPMSNYVSPPQLVEDVPYADLEQMHAFAARWRRDHLGQWFTAGKLSGFCVLIKRAVYEAVGGLDERFGLGFFDDDDLAERARRAGFTLAVAHDLFVHHFGSRTFRGAGIDAERLLEENGRRFAEKWGGDVGQGRRVALRAWEMGRGEFHAKTQREDPKTQRRQGISQAGCASRDVKVSLTMIVRDEEANLPHCLESVRGLFDEIVVVDTGSRDRTREIAREFGARVFEFAWVDDFAAARNEALGRATGDYAFWLDADDVIEPAEREKLRAVLEGLGRSVGGGHECEAGRGGSHPPHENAYMVRCACDPDRDGRGGQTVVDHIRLFPLREDVRWTYRVHEQILPALRRANISVKWTDVTVRHTGYTDPALRARKLVRDEAILRAELADRPEDPFVLFNLGSIAVEREDWAGALGFLGRSPAGSAPSDSITRKLFALIARAHQMLGDLPAALAACGEGLSLFADDAEILFRKAVLHRTAAQPAEAEACWRRILTLRRPEEFASVDQGIYGHLTRRNLAALAEERGDRAGAATQWREVLAECPGDAEAVWALRRLDGPVAEGQVRWLVPGSRRRVVPVRGPGDFDPYLPHAFEWVRALDAKVVVELGVRAGSSTRALLAGVLETGGELWAVDLQDIHGIDDPRFHFLLADAAEVADRWEAIDLLHVDTDPHTEEQTRRWFELYAAKCRAIALHDTHHPAFGVGAAVRTFVAGGGWTVHEYWGNPSGWTVLTRPGEPGLEDLKGGR